MLLIVIRARSCQKRVEYMQYHTSLILHCSFVISSFDSDIFFSSGVISLSSESSNYARGFFFTNIMPKRTNQIQTRHSSLSISGTLFDTDSSKYVTSFFSLYIVGFLPSGFTKSVESYTKNRPPNPYPHEMTPFTSPLWSGNHSHAHSVCGIIQMP